MMILSVWYVNKFGEKACIKFSVYGEESAKAIVKMLKKSRVKVISADLAITWEA